MRPPEFVIKAADKIVKRYAAARPGDGWNAPSANPRQQNELIRRAKPIVTNRVEQLVRDMPHFSRAINVLSNYIIGSGTNLQSQIRDDNNVLQQKLNSKIENRWKLWCERCDVAGKDEFGELENLVCGENNKGGEFLVIKHVAKTSGNPLRLQVISASRLTEYGAAVEKGNEIFMGVEYDPLTLRNVAYHIQTGTYLTKTVRVPAEYVVYGYKRTNPEQMRGMSIFTPAVMLVHDLDDYMTAELDAARMMSKWLAFIETPDVGNRQHMNGVRPEPNTTKKIEELTNATVEYLNAGEKITFNSAARPAGAFEPYSMFLLRTMAIISGISYELLTGDYRGINYSNLRGIRNDLKKSMEPMQSAFHNKFNKPVFREFLKYEYLTNGIDMPGYERNPDYYCCVDFVAPGIDSPDPLREGKANIADVQAGFRSPQDVIKARGGDPDTVLAQHAEWNKKCDDLGLNFDVNKIDTTLTQNPAADAGDVNA